MNIETQEGNQVPLYEITYQEGFLHYFVVDKILYYGKSKTPQIATMNATQKYHDHALQGF